MSPTSFGAATPPKSSIYQIYNIYYENYSNNFLLEITEENHVCMTEMVMWALMNSQGTFAYTKRSFCFEKKDDAISFKDNFTMKQRINLTTIIKLIRGFC